MSYRDTAHALELVDRIVRAAACPVIVIVHVRNPDFVREASKRRGRRRPPPSPQGLSSQPP